MIFEKWYYNFRLWKQGGLNRIGRFDLIIEKGNYFSAHLVLTYQLVRRSVHNPVPIVWAHGKTKSAGTHPRLPEFSIMMSTCKFPVRSVETTKTQFALARVPVSDYIALQSVGTEREQPLTGHTSPKDFRGYAQSPSGFWGPDGSLQRRRILSSS